MDLSFEPREYGTAAAALPTALAVLMASFLARQAASRTARINASLVRTNGPDALTAPADGAFNGSVASSLTFWQQG